MIATSNNSSDSVLVSVIIPNYNYAHYLGQCLQSVINSDFESDKMEVIIVDDASTDESVNVIEEIMKGSPFPVRLIKNETNLGLISSRNRGIAYARGEFLFFLDSDNYIRKDCLKIHVATLRQNHEAMACYAPIQNFLHETGENCGLRSNQPFDYLKLLEAPYIDAMAMFRRFELIKAGMYDNMMPPYGWEDYELWLRVGKMGGTVAFIPGEPLSFYRVHHLNKSLNFKSDQLKHLIYYLKQKYPVTLSLLPTQVLESLVIQKKYFAQLFYQTGSRDFNEDNSACIEISNNPLPFKLPTGQCYSRLRFDPLNDFAVVKLKSIRFFDNENEVIINFRLTSNACVVENSVYYFSNSDPQILIETEGTVEFDHVGIDAEYLATGIKVFDALEIIIKQRQEKTRNLKNESAQMNFEETRLNEDFVGKTLHHQIEISQLNSKIEALKNEIVSIKRSSVYRFAKSLSLLHPAKFYRWVNKKITLQRNIRLIRESSLFEVDFYLQNNPDVKESGMDAEKHFLLYGGFESRNPSTKFDSVFYLAKNPDVKEVGMNPLVHYIKYGKKEGRLPKSEIGQL